MKQRTLKTVAALRGVGLHSGVEAEVVLRPAKAGTGVVLRRVDGVPVEFKVGPDMVRERALCTLVENAQGVGVSTVEHLMSALHGLGVDNVLVEIGGPEVPILDGSALPWVELLDGAGREELEAERDWLKIEKVLTVDEGGRVLVAEPDARAGLRVECTVDFPNPMIGRQNWRGVVDEETYRREIAPARTFVQEQDIEHARRAGLIKGGSLENAVVFGDDGTVLTPGGLRFSDEPVRHKALDVIGDFYMAGRPVWGRLTMTAPGHTANNRLLRKICG